MNETLKDIPLKARPYRMRNAVLHYPWGTAGEDALIPRLLGQPAVPGRPYAELWMGAHPSAPSVIGTGRMQAGLDRLVHAHPGFFLGQEVRRKFNGCFPFLLKIISVAAPLSIQLHPGRKDAERLHKSDPGHFPDSHHKPEIAIALDSLTAFAGCRPTQDLRSILSRYPEIGAFLNGRQMRAPGARMPAPGPGRTMERSMRSLIEGAASDPALFSRNADALALRLNRDTKPLSETESIFLESRDLYGSRDPGLFLIFFLNLVHVGKNEGLFIAPGTPHAYVRGNAVECMAQSDNVVRAGLTRKPTDGQAFLDLMNCQARPRPLVRLGRRKESVFGPPVGEFRVVRRECGPRSLWRIRTASQPEILLCMGGRALLSWSTDGERDAVSVQKGDSFLIPAALAVYTVEGQESAELFRVSVPRRKRTDSKRI